MRRHDSRLFRPRALLVVAAALAVAAAACAPVAPSASPLRTPAPTAPATAAPTSRATPSEAPSTSDAATTTPTSAPTTAPTTAPTGSPDASPTPAPTGAGSALSAVKAYEDALVARRWQQAWAMLGPGQQNAIPSIDDWTRERQQFLAAAGSDYKLTANPPDLGPLSEWVQDQAWASEIDMANAVVVEVEWTALANNNAGTEVLVANPTPKAWLLYFGR